MIGFEKAYEIAKEMKPEIDNCTEYENGFVFGCSTDENCDGGYGHCPVVVLKSEGNTVAMNVFVLNSTGAEVRNFDLK